MRAAPGFTLIELLLVLTIMAILAGAAVSTFDGDDLALETAARQVAADLAAAQTLAMQCRLPVGLAADLLTGRTTFVLADGTPPRAAETRLRNLGRLSPADLERLLAAQSHGERGFGAVRITAANFAGADRVVFEADGTPSAGGMFELTLDGSWLRVRCAVASGRITTTAP